MVVAFRENPVKLRNWGFPMASRESRILKDFLLTLQPEEKKYEVMDTEIDGFGVRVSPAGQISFIFRFSLNNRDGSGTLGVFPGMKVAAARQKAEVWRGQVADGIDPRVERRRIRSAQTVKEFLLEWLGKHVAGLSKKTQKDYGRIVRKIIIPRMGTRLMPDVCEKDALELHQALAEHPRSANVALSVFSSAMSTAEAWGQRKRGTNPCLNVVRFVEDERTRALDEAEMAAFGAFLDEHEEKHAVAVGQLRLLLMTGARLSEVRQMEWAWVDLEEGIIRIPRGKHKTGRKTKKERLVALGPHALDMLQTRSTKKLSKWVFPGESGPYKGLESWWQRRRSTELKKIGLEDFHIHDLRHTFATWARKRGLELDDVGDLLGHTTNRQTRRYAHIAAAKLKANAGTVEGAMIG